jgi:hypothetical protein
MTRDADDFGDAKSREEARSYPETFEKSNLGTGRTAPRRIPTSPRRYSPGDLISIILGIAIVLAICGGHILGYY